MKIDSTTVDRIARLAKLDFSDHEKDVMASQLSSIVSYVEKLGEVPTDDVPETNQVTDQQDIVRPDAVVAQPDVVVEALLAAAPAVDGRGVAVKTILAR